MSTEVEVPEIPDCNLCNKVPAAYDAKTTMGPWAFMCEGCWSVYGIGRLGTGFGQRLIKRGKSAWTTEQILDMWLADHPDPDSSTGGNNGLR